MALEIVWGGCWEAYRAVAGRAGQAGNGLGRMVEGSCATGRGSACGERGPGPRERRSMRAGWRASAWSAVLLAGVLMDWPAARAATDFSGETEFASSDPSKYPDTRSVVPYQPVRQRYAGAARQRCAAAQRCSPSVSGVADTTILSRCCCFGCACCCSPQQSNLNLLEIGTNWFFMVRPPGYGSVASRFLFF